MYLAVGYGFLEPGVLGSKRITRLFQFIALGLDGTITTVYVNQELFRILEMFVSLAIIFDNNQKIFCWCPDALFDVGSGLRLALAAEISGGKYTTIVSN